MPFLRVRTIDNKSLWLNLERVTAFSYSSDERICLIEISGGEPHQISMEEFSKIEPLLRPAKEKPKPKKK